MAFFWDVVSRCGGSQYLLNYMHSIPEDSIFILDVGVVLCFGAIWFHQSVPTTSQRNMLSPSSGLK
jgi:hypothetical protein